MGYYLPVKGQDVLASAILKLPIEIRCRCEFIFCGDALSDEPEILQVLNKMSEELGNVSVISGLPRNELFKLYNEVDAVVVPSRYESFSAVAGEAMMMGKVLICSDKAGICEFLENGKNALVFQSENITELAKAISFTVVNYEELEDMRKKAQDIWREEFSEENFEKRLIDLLEGDYRILESMNDCYGCGHCVKVCPRNAIEMQPDEKGFRYPVIHKELCDSCGICRDQCPILTGENLSANEKCNGVISPELVRSIVHHHPEKEVSEDIKKLAVRECCYKCALADKEFLKRSVEVDYFWTEYRSKSIEFLVKNYEDTEAVIQRKRELFIKWKEILEKQGTLFEYFRKRDSAVVVCGRCTSEMKMAVTELRKSGVEIPFIIDFYDEMRSFYRFIWDTPYISLNEISGIEWEEGCDILVTDFIDETEIIEKLKLNDISDSNIVLLSSLIIGTTV